MPNDTDLSGVLEKYHSQTKQLYFHHRVQRSALIALAFPRGEARDNGGIDSIRSVIEVTIHLISWIIPKL
jgi:hypothetical protein